MERPEGGAKAREINSLLDQIQQLPHNQDGEAVLQRAANPYFQQWSTYHTAYLAAADTMRRSRSPVRGGASVNPWFLVLATALNTIVAAVLAVLITLSVVRQDLPRVSESASAPPPQPDVRPQTAPRASLAIVDPPATPPLSRRLEIAPVGSPEHPLRLAPLRPAPFPLALQPEEANADSYILLLSGVPAKVEIRGAERIGADSWLVSSYALSRLQIIMPEWVPATIELGIELRRTNGIVAARSIAWVAVPPPLALQSKRKADPATVKAIVQNGDQLLGRGDIVAARAVYTRAADLGSAEAAFALGSTYDPGRLWSLGVFGMVGNRERARYWYARADQLGHASAKERLRALGD